jgi:hypothetical protein
MPTYTFRDKQTGIEFDKFMSMSARESFLIENPHYEQIIVAVALVDPTHLSTMKRDSGFKEVLQKIHERTPGSDLKKMNAF